MSAAAVVTAAQAVEDAVERKMADVLGLADLAKLDEELRNDATSAERRQAVVARVAAGKDALEVAAMRGRPEANPMAFKLAGEILIAEAYRQSEKARQAREKVRADERARRAAESAGRPARFHALPPMQQALQIAEAAPDWRAGLRALVGALAKQEAGEELPVPHTFEPEHLGLGEIRRLASAGLLDENIAEQAERQNLLDAASW